MNQYEAALVAVGGWAGLGALIDMCLYPSVRKRLIGWMEHWWLRFGEVQWSNFGRKESEAAIAILDRRAGPKLWSWKRWRISAAVCAGVMVLLVAWTIIRYRLHDLGFPFGVEQYPWFLGMFAPSVFLFALSLSATRWLARGVLRVSTSMVPMIVAFVALLLSHLILLSMWSSVVGYATQQASTLIAFAFFLSEFEVMERQLDATQLTPIRFGWGSLIQFWNYDPNGIIDIQFELDFVLAILANGIRIVFALAFLSSFVFRPLVQAPILALWYGVMNSPRGIFTALFTVIGVAIGLTKVVLK